MGYNNHFGRAFKTVRLARNLTQEDFSDSSGRTYISEVERDMKRPTISKVDELAEPLKVHPLTILALAYSTETIPALEKLLAQVRREAEEIIQGK